LAPTAEIFPSVMTTVPFSMTGPLTGYTFPPVIAIVCASALFAMTKRTSALRVIRLYEIID